MTTRIRILTTAAAVAALAILAACSSSAASTNGGSSSGGATSATGGTSTTASASSGAPPSSASTHSRSSVAADGSSAVCSLLTAAQASSLNNVTYGATTARHVANGWDECSYKNNGSKDPVDIQDLKVSVITIAGCFDQLKAATGATGDKPVSGVGDKALGYSIGLLVQAGSKCVEVEGLTRAELRGDYGPDIAMAKIVIGKLR
jgi:hypothetical protein